MMVTIASVTAITLLIVVTAYHPEDPRLRSRLPSKFNKPAGTSKGIAPWVSSYYVTEILLGNMVFWMIGGKVLCSSYIEDFVVQSQVISEDKKALALLAVWIAIAVGRFVGLYDLIRLNSLGPSGIFTLYRHLLMWATCGLFGALFWIANPTSHLAFWIGVIVYGFGNGPCVAYIYDLNNRLTTASEVGMSIVM